MSNSDFITEQLNLDKSYENEINSFLQQVSCYKLIPYINLIKENNNIFEKLQEKHKEITNKWLAVFYLYRYNIKLSTELYPYLVVLETILKTRINNILTENYSDYWFRDETLLLNANRINNINDLAIYNKYKDLNTNNDIEKDINQDFQLINDQLRNIGEKTLSQNIIKEKIKHIKRCCYLYQQTQEAVSKNQRITCMDFIENHVTFGYWISILSISEWWNKNPNLIQIFSKINESDFSKTKIYNKLDNIRILRNKISHYGRIIGKYQIKNTNKAGISLIDVYNDILDIFQILGVNPDNDINIIELKCNQNSNCKKRSFKILYDDLDFIHDYEIKAKKIVNENIIEMQSIESSYFKEIGYDYKTRVFQVLFNGGEIYQYYRVPGHLYDKLLTADSKGKFFIKNIRDNFQYRKVN